MRITAIIKELEAFAPPMLQENWDNTGLQVGSGAVECTGVLVCLDPTPAIVEEAVMKNCNLIVSHHPLFFKPVKRLTGSTKQQATAINAIAAGISIYSSHTAADSTRGGVSYILAEKLGINPIRTLDPLADRYVHLRVMVPHSHAEKVRAALFDAGAGACGTYDCCSFNTDGYGTFRALDGSNPYVGTQGSLHTEKETAIDMILPAPAMGAVEAMIHEVHPYECPAYEFTAMLNRIPSIGLGVYGTMKEGMKPADFVEHVKNTLGCNAVRTTALPDNPDMIIRRVAVCGGAGGSLIANAMSAGAQAYITGDVRYHDFTDCPEGMLLIDAGHYETEAPVKQVFADVISRKFPDIPVYVSDVEGNPVFCR